MIHCPDCGEPLSGGPLACPKCNSEVPQRKAAVSRRGFFHFIAGVIGAWFAARFLPEPKEPLYLTIDELAARYIEPAIASLSSAPYMSVWTVKIATGPVYETGLYVAAQNRFDLLAGFGKFYPEFAVRICDDPPEPREWLRMKFDPARLPA